ncbi:hypothetical protein [Formosa sp. 4Alg 33]|uniref:hypothetical protein n=1 Tax=Formosa sp. 4Alg 33 TaxID=3382189 RepID=UPI003D9C682A
MGLFKILTAAKAIADFATDENTIKAANNIKTLSGEVSEKFRDINGDGGFDMDDFNWLLETSCMYSSIIGHISTVDSNEIREEEMDVAIEIINNICFSEDGLLNDEVVEFSQLSKKQIRNKVYDKFSTPYSLKKISKYAINIEKEEEFYSIAYSIVMADEEVSENEKEFLDIFSKELEFSKFDVRNIERQIKKLL